MPPMRRAALRATFRAGTWDGSRPYWMGVLNVTPDSFSDGGELADVADVMRRAEALVAAGADMLDIGGEATNPRATPASEGEELARVFPALRALRLFRLFKLARYVPAFAIVGAAVRRAWEPLMAALCVAAAQLYIAAMVLYLIEGDTKPQAFGSIARAMWWAVVTLTTVGYGDVYPDSTWGRVAAGLVALAGVGIVAMPTGILASAFAEEFRERHEAEQRARRGESIDQ